MRVLVVDDDGAVRRSIERTLRYAGCEVRCAGDGRQALYLLQTIGQFDVVVTDYNMPRMNGLDLLTNVRDEFPGARRVMMTADLRDEHVQQAIVDRTVQFAWEKGTATDLLVEGVTQGAPRAPQEAPEEPEEPEEALLEVDINPEVAPVQGRLTRAHVESLVIGIILDTAREMDWGAVLHHYVTQAKDRPPTDRERRWAEETINLLTLRLERLRRAR